LPLMFRLTVTIMANYCRYISIVQSIQQMKYFKILGRAKINERWKFVKQTFLTTISDVMK